jgi:hypothetical protein
MGKDVTEELICGYFSDGCMELRPDQVPKLV